MKQKSRWNLKDAKYKIARRKNEYRLKVQGEDTIFSFSSAVERMNLSVCENRNL